MDRARGTTQHGFGLVAHGQQRVILLADGNHRWLIEENAFTADVDKRIGGPEIDREVIRHHAGKSTKEHARPSSP